MSTFMAQSAALQGSAANWAGLTQAAQDGNLQLEPGVAEQCAKHCEEMIATLHHRLAQALALKTKINMGDCNIGQALQTKYLAKVASDSNSASSVIRLHQNVLREMAATYRAAGSSFRSQEQGNTTALGG